VSLEIPICITRIWYLTIRTPTEAAWDAPDSHISIARKLQQEQENAHILDQYTNINNPLAHYDNGGSIKIGGITSTMRTYELLDCYGSQATIDSSGKLDAAIVGLSRKMDYLQ